MARWLGKVQRRRHGVDLDYRSLPAPVPVPPREGGEVVQLVDRVTWGGDIDVFFAIEWNFRP